MADLTLYREWHSMSRSQTAIFHTRVDTTVTCLGVVDNQGASINLKATSKISISQVTSRDNLLNVGITWCTEMPVHRPV